MNKESAEIKESIRLYLEEQGEYVTFLDAAHLLTQLEKYEEISFAPTMAFVRQYLEKYKEKVFIVKNASDREHLLEYLESK